MLFGVGGDSGMSVYTYVGWDGIIRLKRTRSFWKNSSFWEPGKGELW